MAEPNKHATMRQVAEMAGVSAMTVSKALGNKPGVSEETRKRVFEVAKRLHYTPNMLAKSFRTDRTNTIGVIMSSNFEEVFTMLFHGIEAAATEQGFGTLLATTEDDLHKEQEIIQLLVSKRVDGLILTSALLFSEEQRLMLEKMGVPYVLTVRSYPDVTVTTVSNNNYMGAYSMVDYLVRTGSRRFLFLALDAGRSSSKERLRGWGEALAAHGLSVAPEHVSFAPPYIEGGFDLVRKHLRNGMAWDTVVCGNDLIALGCMEGLMAEGIAIPGQVRVCGYDGIPLSGYLRIPLTTVQQPLYEIGQSSVYLLANKIANPNASPQQVIVNSKLVIRSST